MLVVSVGVVVVMVIVAMVVGAHGPATSAEALHEHRGAHAHHEQAGHERQPRIQALGHDES